MGYYDLDDILADSIEIPCKFRHDIAGLGYLEDNPGKPIKTNTKLELPLWLARILAIVGDTASSDGNDMSMMEEEGETIPFVELLTPNCFSSKVINAIKTDSVALDLHTISPYFYLLVEKWISLFSDKNLSAVVNDLLLSRGREINNYASSVATTETSSYHSQDHGMNLLSSTFLLTLDEFEKKVYKSSQESYKESKKWVDSK